MRYDMVTKDALRGPVAPEFSSTPGTPRTVAPPVTVHPESFDSEDGEDSVVPLFPDSDAFNDPDYVPDDSPPVLRGWVRIRLDEVARKRGLVITSGRFRGKTNLSSIVRGTGLAYATVFKLLRTPGELTGVSFEVLTRLCEFLHCTPGDLLTWEPRASEPQTSISDYFQRRERRDGRAEGPGVGDATEETES